MIIYIGFVVIVQNTPNLAAFPFYYIEFCKVYLDAKVLDFMIF